MMDRFITTQDGKYYFFDEKLCKHGPYDSEEEVMNALDTYANNLYEKIKTDELKNVL